MGRSRSASRTSSLTEWADAASRGLAGRLAAGLGALLVVTILLSASTSPAGLEFLQTTLAPAQLLAFALVSVLSWWLWRLGRRGRALSGVAAGWGLSWAVASFSGSIAVLIVGAVSWVLLGVLLIRWIERERAGSGEARQRQESWRLWRVCSPGRENESPT